MKKFLLMAFLAIPYYSFCQQNLKKIRHSSWQTFVYKITAADAEQFLKWDSIPVSRFIEAEPFLIALADSADTDTLPVGHYVQIRVMENNVQATAFNNTRLHVLTINNKNNLQLDVRTKDGALQTMPTAFLKEKAIPFNASSKTFWITRHQLDEAMVKICTPGDTTFIELAGMDDESRTISEQRRQNYHYTKIYRILNWLPAKIKQWTRHTRKYKSNRIGALGYIIFNQPKYKPLDTVKFKGYVVNKKWKQYKQPVQVFLGYTDKGKYVNQFIQVLKPVSDGAFVGSFVLADTIPSDVTCTLSFKTASGKEIIRNNFKLEDYVLDEMGSFTFSANEDVVYANDSIGFTASSKDANGLHVLDATATLVITTTEVSSFYRDSVLVTDTLYYEEKKLLTNADTKFSFSTNNLPAANLTLNAVLIFKNSNNELHQEYEKFDYIYQATSLTVSQQRDSIKVLLFVNGKQVNAGGEMEMNDELPKKIRFPYTAKIDPIAEDYTFYYTDAATGKTIDKNFKIGNDYRVDFDRTSQRDTLGFMIGNPYQVPVYYTVFFGKTIIATGKDTSALIVWKKKMDHYRRSYKVRWQYIWAGEEKYGEESIGLFYKLLDIKINTSESVFPGQNDNVKITVKDFMGKPAANVNLTAVSYNNQFNKDTRVAQPPYLARYKGKKYLLREGFENDGDYVLSKQYRLGINEKWISRFHLDTMLYYKILFPANGYFDAVTPLTNSFIPQLSVQLMQNGVPQQIYLLYVNQQLVYYNGVTDKMAYSFETMPENVKLGIRLKDRFIEIDSLYMQPYYKHDLSFDLDQLPKHSTINTAEKCWSTTEMNLLENSLWQMKNDYYNNDGYVWQYNKVVKLSGNRRHIAGPFTAFNQLQFFNPNSFDLQFNFEPGYEYSLAKQVSRLEKQAIFPHRDINNWLPGYPVAMLPLGDTLAEPPAIRFAERKTIPYLRLSKDVADYQYYARKISGKGRIQFTLPKDTSIRYLVLQSENENAAALVLSNEYGYNNRINNIAPGNYTLYLLTTAFYTAVQPVKIERDGTLCINVKAFEKENDFINELIKKSKEPLEPVKTEAPKMPEPIYTLPDEAVFVKAGGATITGKITDKKGGHPIAGASVVIKGTKTGVVADLAGNFSFSRLKEGKHVLVIASVGYMGKEVSVTVTEGNSSVINVYLTVSSNALNEVVVVGYGTVSKRSLTGSISTISSKELSFNNALAGKVPGIQIRGQSSGRFDSSGIIRLRGEGSLNGGSNIMYVIDGIVYNKLPVGFNMDNVSDVTVLTAENATALFGQDGANGAIVITTTTKTLRTQFRDYAFWQPNFFTDKNGEASFEVTYPDNITGWKTFVIGMDKKRRIGKASTLIQSYKPVVAQLAIPQFLLEGDAATIVGKSKNYSADIYTATSSFTINGVNKNSFTKTIQANESVTEAQDIIAGTDTVLLAYQLHTTTGFKDGEEKKIPVFKKGIEETSGNFWLLQKDTSFNYSLPAHAKEVTIYAENNALDVLLDELEHLKSYPYYCMEQTASKLLGYGMEQKIRTQLKQHFTNEKEMNRLLTKLQKAQQFDGGWAWWENGKSNFYITNYITNALLQFRTNVLVETNVRNAYLYLQNQLPFLQKHELLAALVTLNNGNHEMNYDQWLNRIAYDSLNELQQWQWVKIKQGQHLEYQQPLKKLVQQQTGTILGGIHWGEDNYSWYSNNIAATVIAFEVLRHEKQYENLLPRIIQFFLERRKGRGYWRNTVESASILNAILPTILEQQHDFNKEARISISGDTTIATSTFPYKIKLQSENIKNLQITKSGGGLVYFTAYEKTFNPAPLPVDSNFIIHTYFEKNGQLINNIKAGEKTKMIIKVELHADAQYVMLQVPIPAGCIYATKKNNDWTTWREFYKDKMLLFTEQLNKGTHYFEIELEPRYNGTYTLNPAKAELMYFPTFYGRNEMKQVRIE